MVESPATTLRPEPPLRRSLADHVVQALANDIAAGRRPPGSRLPTGAQLAASYGVSLAVIREALSSLRADGLIETRQGSGAWVAHPSADQPFRIMTKTSSGPERARAIFELRMGAEVTAAGLAASRASPEQVDDLRAVDLRMRAAVASGGDGVDEDLEFHRLIAEGTNNDLFVKFIVFVSHHIRDSIELSRTSSGTGYISDVLAEHEAIVNGILLRDVRAAEEAASRHMLNCLSRCA